MKALREAHGGRIVLGGPDNLVDALPAYFPPTVVVDPRPDSMLMTEEIFGPILPIISVESVDAAVAFITKRPKPLALYIFSDADTAENVLSRTSSGTAVVNDVLLQKGCVNLPFGGIGASGMGKLHGHYAFNELSNIRSVLYRSTRVPSLFTNFHPIPNIIGRVAELYVKYFRPEWWWKWASAILMFIWVRMRLKRLSK